jgi:hypothetical protein
MLIIYNGYDIFTPEPLKFEVVYVKDIIHPTKKTTSHMMVIPMMIIIDKYKILYYNTSISHKKLIGIYNK